MKATEKPSGGEVADASTATEGSSVSPGFAPGTGAGPKVAECRSVSTGKWIWEEHDPNCGHSEQVHRFTRFLEITGRIEKVWIDTGDQRLWDALCDLRDWEQGR